MMWLIITAVSAFALALVLTYIIWLGATYYYDYCECNSWWNLLHPTCVATGEIINTLRNQALTFLLKGVTYTASLIVAGYSAINGLLPSLASIKPQN